MTLHLEPVHWSTKYLPAERFIVPFCYFTVSKQHNTEGCEPGDVYPSSEEYDQVLPL